MIDFKTYQDIFGYTSLKPRETSQNGELFTVQYLLIAEQVLPKPEFDAEVARIKLLFELSQAPCGLQNRYPGDREHNSMDNLTASLVFSALYDQNKSYAKFIHAYSKTSGVTKCDTDNMSKKTWFLARLLNGFGPVRGVFNNADPHLFRLFSWFGRSPGFMGLIDMAATGRTSLFRKTALFMGQFLGLFQDHHDGIILPYVTWQFLRTQSSWWERGYKFWLSRVNKKLPLGVQSAMNSYFGVDHPLAAQFRVR